VDWLESHRTPRPLAVFLVFAAIFLFGTLLVVLLLPALAHQVRALLGDLPRAIDWLQLVVVPYLSELSGISTETLNFDELKSIVRDHWKSAGGLVIGFVNQISKSGLLAVAWIGNLVLIPVVTFYLLRDWDVLVAKIRDLFPRSVEPTVSELARESDAVLAEFFRGQLLVMVGLAFVYTIGLWLAGLKLAILIGLLAGVVSFVPYLGVVLGLAAATVAALIQFDSMLPLVYVALVFGVGQVLEGFVLTPLLVGDKIGLHPVAVIFSVLAGGQLFGFFGVLLALPVAAVIVVILRHLHGRYLDSAVYNC
jgi:predicted PurR-regulated permease PerM